MAAMTQSPGVKTAKESLRAQIVYRCRPNIAANPRTPKSATNKLKRPRVDMRISRGREVRSRACCGALGSTTALDFPANAADGANELFGTVAARIVGAGSDCNLARLRRETK